MSSNIHPTAVVSEKSELSGDIEVGPYAVIEENVKIGRGVKVHSHAHILSHTTIGEDCQIHIGAVLGHLPQIRASLCQSGRLIIGRRNIFREYVTLHRSSHPQGATTIGDDNYLMAFSHIAHDCVIGNNVTICNGALIAGHALVEDYAFISGNVTVHQFCRIGKFSMVGGLARVARDVPPYMLVKGDSAVWAVNSVGLRRANFSAYSRAQIKNAFKLLYKSGLNVKQAIGQLRTKPVSCEIEHLIDFILHSQRGICRHKNPAFWERIRLGAAIAGLRQIPAYQLFRGIGKHLKCPNR